jgi:hypothetical protein
MSRAFRRATVAAEARRLDGTALSSMPTQMGVVAALTRRVAHVRRATRRSVPALVRRALVRVGPIQVCCFIGVRD